VVNFNSVALLTLKTVLTINAMARVILASATLCGFVLTLASASGISKRADDTDPLVVAMQQLSSRVAALEAKEVADKTRFGNMFFLIS
jgi:hypothetical protein